jgi:hypothetical protein
MHHSCHAHQKAVRSFRFSATYRNASEASQLSNHRVTGVLSERVKAADRGAMQLINGAEIKNLWVIGSRKRICRHKPTEGFISVRYAILEFCL